MIALLLAAALLHDPDAAKSSSAPVASAETKVEQATAPASSDFAATVECTAHADGRISDCAVVSETHPGLGFGRAAVALMNESRIEPGAREARFTRTIRFTP